MPVNKLLKPAHAAAWRARNPEKVRALKAVFVALRAKKIEREPCFICGEGKAEAHHVAYDRPLLVTWLCKKHHTQAHLESRR